MVLFVIVAAFLFANASSQVANDVNEPDVPPECGTCGIEPAPVTLRSRAEQSIPETIIVVPAPLAKAPRWVCGEPRTLEQGSGTVRECAWVRQ